ncbi:MAG: hypothetical protein VX498_00200, partial [Myxococcota bacterium]|nr:hypothetical protein [Myxococcota bacterium]
EKDSRGPVFAKERDGRPVEPHTDLVLKSLLEAGYELEAELKPGVRLRDLLEASRRRLVVEGAGAEVRFPTPNDAPWSVQAWCEGTAAGAPDSWPASGQVLRLEDLTRALLAQLESETHFIRQAMTSGGSFQKRKQAIFRYTCGGAHLFQATASCAALGWPVQGNSAERVRKQIEIYLRRVPVETSMVDEALRAYPQLAILLHNQDLKFLGHLIESLGKVERAGLWTPSSQERLVLEDVQARAVATVIQLERLGAYRPETMAQFSGNPDTFQLYLDLVGDAAHALHGLRIQGELAKSR